MDETIHKELYMIEHLRIQDIVARTAGVSLRDTVKCLRSLSMVSRQLGEEYLANELDLILTKSAEVNGHISKLQDLPGTLNSQACDKANKLLERSTSRTKREIAFRLLDCPFEKAKVLASIEKLN